MKRNFQRALAQGIIEKLLHSEKNNILAAPPFLQNNYLQLLDIDSCGFLHFICHDKIHRTLFLNSI
jgi:hypothetical protein